MSAALDAAARSLEAALYITERKWSLDAAKAAIRSFLDYVENSQQPISRDAMQTLRAHLGEG